MKYSLVGPVYPYRGGIAHYTTCLARALMNHGHQVQIISFRRQYPNWLYPGKSDRDPSQQPLKIDAQFDLDPINPWTWLKTAKIIRQHQPDATIISWWTTFWAPSFWALSFQLRRSCIPVIFLIHNVLPHEVHMWDVWLAKTTLKNGSVHIVQSYREQQRLLALLPNSMVRYHPHPIYPFFNGQPLPQNEVKEKLGIPLDRKVILFFGIVRPYKGLKYLIEAIARLISQGKNVHLLIAGEFWENKRPYLQQIHALGISNRITIDDRYIPNEELRWYFSTADLFVAPYSNGTQSGVVTLALAFGLPVVLTDKIAQGLPEGTYNLRIVPSEDPEALAQGIEEVILNLPSNHIPPPKTFDEGWSKLVSTIITSTPVR